MYSDSTRFCLTLPDKRRKDMFAVMYADGSFKSSNKTFPINIKDGTWPNYDHEANRVLEFWSPRGAEEMLEEFISERAHMFDVLPKRFAVHRTKNSGGDNLSTISDNPESEHFLDDYRYYILYRKVIDDFREQGAYTEIIGEASFFKYLPENTYDHVCVLSSVRQGNDWETPC